MPTPRSSRRGRSALLPALPALLTLGLGLPPAVFAASPPKPTETAGATESPALRVARALQLQKATEGQLSLFLPAGDGRELGLQMLRQDTGFWARQEAQTAALYERHFRPDEARELAVFLESPVGQKWVASQTAIAQELMAQLSQGEGLMTTMAEIGCTVALVAPNLAKAKEKAGIETPGIPPQLEPKIAELRTFCTCVIQESVKKWGPERLMTISQEEGYPQFLEQLVQKGTSSLPGLYAPS